MKLNRELQLEILKYLRDQYPYPAAGDDEFMNREDQEFIGNLHYLSGHNLIEIHAPALKPGYPYFINTAKITSKGLDFLEDDGGLGAILGTVTVKLDPSDLRQIIETRIAAADIAETDKSSLRHAIRSLPADALRKLTLDLVGKAVERLPDALQLIQTCVAQSS